MLKHSVIDCFNDPGEGPSSRAGGEKEWKNKECAKADADLLIIDSGWYFFSQFLKLCCGHWYWLLVSPKSQMNQVEK